MEDKYVIQLVYLAAVSILGIILMIYDKIAAKMIRKHRVPEATLMTVGILFGAPAMYIVMQLIRHKTRTPKFSVGFPIIIIFQIAAAVALNVWVLSYTNPF